jgi:hypothetical protein
MLQKFWIDHWQFTITTALAIIGLVLAYAALK